MCISDRRTYHLVEILNREVQLSEIKASIQMRAREDIDQQQREYFLQQQIKTIQDELGGTLQLHRPAHQIPVPKDEKTQGGGGS